MRSTPVFAVLAVAGAVLASGCDTARPVTEASNSAAERCSGCHGFPPPPFVRTGDTHPASTSCSLCHGTTVDASYGILAGGTHMNGRVDVTTHPLPWVAQHAGAALADLNTCTVCHGDDFSGGKSGVSCTSCHAERLGISEWQTNCTFCHGDRTPGWSRSDASLALAAPPRGAHGETLTSDPQVGAHQKHVGNGSAVWDGVACSECHTVPADLSHLDGAAPAAFGPLASQGGLAPAYAGGSCSATYCHGTSLAGGAGTTPSWTGSVACGDCHGSPPDTGRHLVTPPHATRSCSACHAQVASSTATPGIQSSPSARALHVNGARNVDLIVEGTWDPATRTCSNVACHSLPPAVRHW